MAQLKTAIDSQQLADAIAAEAHDTLAHSLSPLALNASALQAESKRLVAEAESMDAHQLAEQTGRIAEKTEEIRKQAAGALDEAHSVIDMLRHPEQAREQLAPSDETSLTCESLDALIGDARPTAGVHAHVSNPTIPANGTHLDTNAKDMSRTGAGLPGLAERVRQSGGTCRFGFDPQHTFHMDVQLPWVE